MSTFLFRRNSSGALATARRGSGLLVAAALAGVLAFSSAAGATSVSDPLGDFLGTFKDAHAADLDVTAASVTFSNNTFHLSATVAGNVRATTPGAIYVWGIDRGHGEAVLNQGANPVGAGVKFDSVVVFLPDGSVVLSQINTKDGLFGGFTPLTTGNISGDTLTVDLSLDTLRALPGGDGFDIRDLQFNFWPRTGANVRDGREVSDFAPGDADGVGSTFSIPEPGTLTLMMAGLAGIGATRRRVRAR